MNEKTANYFRIPASSTVFTSLTATLYSSSAKLIASLTPDPGDCSGEQWRF